MSMRIKKVTMALRIIAPTPRDIRSNIRLLKSTEKEKPLVTFGLDKFFHGSNKVWRSFFTEKKYGRKIKILTRASKKPAIYMRNLLGL